MDYRPFAHLGGPGVGCNRTIPAATITPDEATLKYFPQETQGIVFIDVAALRNAPLVQDALNKDNSNRLPPGLDDFQQSTGFDIRRIWTE